MISDRIRQARLAAGLTQEQLVARLLELGQKITKAGLSKYENGGSVPKADFLFALAEILNLRTSFFIAEPSYSVEWLHFRKRAGLGKRKQDQIKSSAQMTIEGQMWLRDTLYPDMAAEVARPIKVNSIDEVEKAAVETRRFWRLGDGPIPSLTNALEDRGCVIVGIDEDIEGFDGLSGWVNESIPVLVSRMNVPDDRFRYNLAHELGHLLLITKGESEAQQEEYAHRFAAAFLVPASTALNELGAKRRSISFQELALLKMEYGLSMQAWVRRARDLEIISDSAYRTLFQAFNYRKWRKKEPIDYNGNEEPVKLRQMVYRALEEKIISPERASELCPGYNIDEIFYEPAGGEGSLTAGELLKMPKAERLKYLAEAAEKAADEYRGNPELTAFEASGDGVWDDRAEEGRNMGGGF